MMCLKLALKVQFDPLISKIIPFGPLIFFKFNFESRFYFYYFSITDL